VVHFKELEKEEFKMFQKTVRGVLLGLMMMLFLTSGIVICAEEEPALANSYQNPEHGFALDYSEG